ncbi:hypothetical protein [Rhodococcus pyridinivorans]|uniref:hypothetical protein n=1 Tax=Rhodococcus pyridinivorans TaxID=103816 RepID=UPI0020785243|nr:hypothetical protein [Rhodococcus pyridinivorans]USI92840.1 hypothetical protein LLA01_24170 [Rhodococcus pyridinivorans]USI92892.1 hypothetical protein LLA01_23475 [Rhodococcus pyridinivorans]
MAPVTTHYGIIGPVPFLDVDISVDNRMFIDPHAIRLCHGLGPFAAAANHCTTTFFDEVTACVGATGASVRQRGLELLQRFEEPWETRLGMAAQGFHGHGGAEDVGMWIWNALNTDLEALVRVGILRQIEDLPLFVEGIDRDITSDITTRIVFDPLADFTADVVARYPQFTAGRHRIDTFSRQVWDPHRRQWNQKSVTLPVAGGKPLLLVPRHWARPTLLMSAGRYYETSVLSFAQREQSVITSNGKILKTPKDVLKTQPGLERGRNTNLAVTQRAHRKDADLVAVFRDFVRAKWADGPGGQAA